MPEVLADLKGELEDSDVPALVADPKPLEEEVFEEAPKSGSAANLEKRPPCALPSKGLADDDSEDPSMVLLDLAAVVPKELPNGPPPNGPEELPNIPVDADAGAPNWLVVDADADTPNGLAVDVEELPNIPPSASTFSTTPLRNQAFLLVLPCLQPGQEKIFPPGVSKWIPQRGQRSRLASGAAPMRAALWLGPLLSFLPVSARHSDCGRSTLGNSFAATGIGHHEKPALCADTCSPSCL
jgi:hypothetical protein